METILKFIFSFDNFSNLCSIAGLGFTVFTFILAIKVKKAVDNTNSKILFKHLSGEEIQELRSLNSSFEKDINTHDKQILKEHLISLKTKLKFLKSHSPTSIPTKKAIKQIKYLYKCDFLNEEDEQIWMNKYKFIRKRIHNANNDDLYEAYRRIIEVIDTTIQLQKSQKIIIQ